jgi:hypothetical protein
VRLQKDFMMLAIAGDQAALAALKKEGPQAMRQPLIAFGEIAPSPVSESERTPGTPPYSHLLYLQWLELGCDVTGFYLEMDDGTTLEFDGSIDERGEDFADEVRLGPSRSIPMALALETDAPEQQGLIRLSPEQFAKIIQEQKARRVGLIYKDGLKSEAGVVGYSVRFRGFL